ncbi:MAG: NAD(+) synthase [Bacillota bacterium]|nr:NAD(+) synthase [Bacillota bacterium]
MDQTIKKLVNWLRKKVLDAGCQGLVFGLSGGVDSAVVAALSKLAFPETSLGLIMPCHSKEEDEEDARLVAKALDLKVEKVDLGPTYDTLINSSRPFSHDLAKSNIKPRLRMTSLYYYGQSKNYLVLGPSNKSEYYVGYFTKHGDSGCDLFVLADFTKDQVYDLARALKIPKKIIDKKPSAGLVAGQSDEDDLGFSYDVLDAYINGHQIESKYKTIIDKMHNNTKHKRTMPEIFKKDKE